MKSKFRLESFIKYFPTIALNGPYFESLSPSERSAQSTRQGGYYFQALIALFSSVWRLQLVQVSLLLPIIWDVSPVRFPQSGWVIGWVAARQSSSVLRSRTPRCSLFWTVCVPTCPHPLSLPRWRTTPTSRSALPWSLLSLPPLPRLSRSLSNWKKAVTGS